MELAKNHFFEVRYNTKLDKLEIQRESWISKLSKTIKRHKLISTITIAFLMFSTLNIVMIFSFMKILQNI